MTDEFVEWLDRFVDEKGLDRQHIFEVEGTQCNLIPLEVVLEHCAIAPEQEQSAILKMLVRLDFYNADVMDYFEHLARAIAI